MPKKGLKIKELAQELGVTSRKLIDKCRESGIPAQNSITKLTDVQAAQARALFRSIDVESEEPPGASPSSF
jgi:hypothetical protein